jgi:glycogen debranching enzyme
LYPAACSPQAWAASTPLSLLESMLGLRFDPTRRIVRLVKPVLPALAGSLVVRNLTLADATVDFRLSNRNGVPTTEVLNASGNLRLLVEA